MNNFIKHVAISSILSGTAGTAWAVTPGPSQPTVEAAGGVGADSSPESVEQQDALAAQWEADARAAGIDPDTAVAGSTADTKTTAGQTQAGQ